MSTAKRNALLLLSVAGICSLLLAMGLPNLVLAPGEPFSLERSSAEEGEGNVAPSNNDLLLWMFRGIFALALVLLPAYFFYALLTAEGRRRLLADLAVIVILFLIAWYFDEHPLDVGSRPQESVVGNPINLEDELSFPVAHFSAEPPSWLPLPIILIVSALAVAVALAAIRFFRQRAHMRDFSLAQLAETAQNTIASLQAGEDFTDVAIRCYREMSRVVREKRGLARETAMTPREFEAQLVGSGLPRESVETLTRIFEQVRYGRVSLGDREERLAVTCLTDIANACRTGGVGNDV